MVKWGRIRVRLSFAWHRLGKYLSHPKVVFIGVGLLVLASTGLLFSDIKKISSDFDCVNEKVGICLRTHEDQPYMITTQPLLPSKTRDGCSPVNTDWFPVCRSKYKQFNKTWNERCHGEKYKVNMSDPCSVLRYLSEVEPWCPKLPSSPTRKPLTHTHLAKIQTNISGLLKHLKHEDFAWIRMRAQSSWSEWVNGAMGLLKENDLSNRKRQRIIFYMGAFDVYPDFLQKAFRGGYLGELVQWTDVICSFYILGHELHISKSVVDIESKGILTTHDNSCAASKVRHVDRIVTDILGTRFLEIYLGKSFPAYRCKLLLLDSFGTEAEFNYAEYTGNLKRSDFGNLNLNLQQFLTMYPHSPDNLFMGFAISKNANSTKKYIPTHKRKNKGVIYGKLPGYYQEKHRYLQILHKYLELHGTVNGTEKEVKKYLPHYVINHGVLEISKLSELLQESKVFIGLGGPYEGPGPLDAVANGCFYINPKLIPSMNRENSAFYSSKPTNRTVASQNPYTEEFIGKPFVHTIDINNDQEVENAIKEILQSKDVPHLPYEFTHEGMLQRVNTFLENLDFCKPGHQWPPLSQMKPVKGLKGESCKSVCFRNGFLCEPAFFRHLNDVKMLKSVGLGCKKFVRVESIYAPSFNSTDQTCILQEMPLLYSCVAHDDHVTRLCPCRTYQKGQVALYKTLKSRDADT